jgi:hypothetical protein
METIELTWLEVKRPPHATQLPRPHWVFLEGARLFKFPRENAAELAKSIAAEWPDLQAPGSWVSKDIIRRSCRLLDLGEVEIAFTRFAAKQFPNEVLGKDTGGAITAPRY